MAKYLKIILLATLYIFIHSSMLSALDSANQDKNGQPLEILNINPNGEDVPAGRQIVFQFNRPVVPVGRMDRKVSEIPITIIPEVKGQWRWLNTSALACLLDEKSALAPATRYEIIVNPGIKAEDGVTLKEPVKHTFITERPKVVHTWFKTWEAPGMPIIRLTFNQPVSQRSVERHLFMTVGINEQQPIRINARSGLRLRMLPSVDILLTR